MHKRMDAVFEWFFRAETALILIGTAMSSISVFQCGIFPANIIQWPIALLLFFECPQDCDSGRIGDPSPINPTDSGIFRR